MVLRVVLGVVAIVVGVVWFFQGLDVLGGYGMSGHLEWTFFGTLLVIAGLATLRGATRLRDLDDA